MKQFFPISLLCACAALGTVSCDDKKGDTAEQVADSIPAIDTLALDRTVSPRTDFYRFANGGWMASHPLPPEYSRYGSFDVLSEEARDAAHEIIEGFSSAEDGTDKVKAYKLYAMSVDTAALDAGGATPILPYLEAVDKIASVQDLSDFLAKEENEGNSYFFGFYVAADEKSSDDNLLNLCQGGLIMGVPDYYAEDAAFAKQQADYRTYVSRLFRLSGTDAAEADAYGNRVFDIEKGYSKLLYTMLELRDSQRNYNKLSLDDFYGKYSFPWKSYLEKRGIAGKVSDLNVAQLDYFTRFDKWVASTPLEDIKLFLKARMLDDAANYLSGDFRKASFDFHSTSISGITEMKPLWKDAVSRVNATMGDVVGKEYVTKFFPPEAKERMTTLVGNLISALGTRIDSLTWMSEATKAKAHEKLAAFDVKIGYPETWRTFENLKVDTSSLYAYTRNIGTFLTNRNLEDLGKPVDRTRWLMNAHEVNAYYNPTTNEICFPAGILRPPFFNMNADDAVNYGAIGVVIGHEMTHGFDDQGANYDAKGNMANWWTAEDKATFDAATSNLAKQYDGIQITPELNANGSLTLGENIADQGGLLISYDAFKMATKDREQTEIDGLTPDQRFFVGYARVWGQNITPEEVVRRTKTDVHSLGEYRVNQALKNIPAFYKAFNVQEGDAMYIAPEERVIIW